MATSSVFSETNFVPMKNKHTYEVEKKIDSLLSDSLPYYSSILRDLNLANGENAEIICDFIIAEINNDNIKPSTKLTHVKILFWFIKYLEYKNFSLVTRDDISDYLNSLRKPESVDPTHKWIGTHNTRQMILSKFFRWLYNKNEFDPKKWVTPPCMTYLLSYFFNILSRSFLISISSFSN